MVIKKGLEAARHDCVPLNLGINRKIPSAEYECVENGRQYVIKLFRYARKGYLFHKHTNGDSIKGFFLDIIAYGVSFLYGRRPVLTLHAGTEQIYFPRKNSRLMTPLFKFLFGAAKAVICDNPEVAKCIIEYGIPADKVFPISPFTVQYLELPDENLEAPIAEFLAAHTPVVLTYVECREEYDLDSVMWVINELSEKMPKIGLIIVGASRERNEIKERLESARILQRSLHLGAVDHAKFLSLLRRVSLYLRCNGREGTSASIREALYFSVPVVANKADSQPEQVYMYPWGSKERMLDCVMDALRETAHNQPSQRSSVALNVPDTVPEEVKLLADCALGAT